MLYSSKLEDQLRVGYELLSEDVYAFLEYPPKWKNSIIPFEGPPETINPQDLESINWSGFHLHGSSWGDDENK